MGTTETLREGNNVLAIQCANDHIIIERDEDGKVKKRNLLLEVIARDLKLDHYYLE